ncbi:MAG: hypothetical protein KIT25_04475 [Enhydrobacter sp.]|nr:MAG: hypothetical protein KIT25_04475 [Enhydrobacter sp.]
MPRLSRHEATVVIPLLRQAAGRGSGAAQRLLHRLEHALGASIDAIRRERQVRRVEPAAASAGGEEARHV